MCKISLVHTHTLTPSLIQTHVYKSLIGIKLQGVNGKCGECANAENCVCHMVFFSCWFLFSLLAKWIIECVCMIWKACHVKSMKIDFSKLHGTKCGWLRTHIHTPHMPPEGKVFYIVSAILMNNPNLNRNRCYWLWQRAQN